MGFIEKSVLLVWLVQFVQLVLLVRLVYSKPSA